MALTQTQVSRGNYKLTISQVARDVDEIARRCGLGAKSRHGFVALYPAFSHARERSAFIGAHLIRAGNLPEFMVVFGHHAHSQSDFLRSVAGMLDSFDNKRPPSYTPTRQNILISYWAAVQERHKTVFGDENEGVIEPNEKDPTIPTLSEVRRQFREEFGQRECPADWPLRKAITRDLGLKLRKDTVGRPRSSPSSPS